MSPQGAVVVVHQPAGVRFQEAGRLDNGYIDFSVSLHHELSKLFPGELFWSLDSATGHHCGKWLYHDNQINVLAIAAATPLAWT